MHPLAARWRVFDTTDELQNATCESILHAARNAIAERGRFDLVLAGGTTPAGIYLRLRHVVADWSNWHIWYGDERCLPSGHEERNSRMAGLVWLEHVAIPAAQQHPMPAELGPVAGAARYATELDGVAEFDLVLLGLGEDGHTASLFPGQAWEAADHAPVLAVFGAPKPPAERVSMAASRLARARQVLYLVTGVGKAEALRQWQSGAKLPMAAIAPSCGVDVWMDRMAAGGTASHFP